MFSEFRARYPTGSLIAELLTIYQGKYVVRVLVQVEGVTLATGLAAADTPEQAEDMARSRAMDVLGIASLMSPAQTRNIGQTAAPQVQPTPSFQTSFGLDRGLSSESLGQATSSALPRESSPALFEQTNTTPASSVYSPPPSAVSDDWLSPEDDSSAWKADSKFKLVDAQTTRSAPIMGDRSPSNDFSGPLPFEEPTASTATNGPIDLSDALVKIDDLLNRLSWTPEQERDYLRRTYNIVGRSLLQDSEVLQFQQYLEIFALISEEIKRLRWTAKQELDYLERTYNKTQLGQLTQKELLQFQQYLDVFAKTTEQINRLRWNQKQGRDYLFQTYGKEGRTQLNYDQLQEFLGYLHSQ